MIRGVLLWLALPFALNAQFTYTTNNGPITITGYTGPGGAVVIPDTINGLPVVEIGGAAFYGNAVLTGITIPGTVTVIGGGAFSQCSRLASVEILNGLRAIGFYAFLSCTNLTSVTIPDSVIWIDPGAFQGCSSLTSVTIPDSVGSIAGSAFAGCASLTTVIIGRRVTSIGEMAFNWCTSLTGVFFEGNAFDLVPFAWYAFDMAGNATVFYLPGTTGWGPTFGRLPTAPWALPNPVILTTPPDFGVGANGYGFIVSWATNASVVVEACEDLALPEWSPVGTNTLVEGWSYFSDAEWTNYASRFYRLRSP
jgi:hypothetical protein